MKTYLPARISSGKDAFIYYSIPDADTGQMKRIRIKFNKIKDTTLRIKMMKEACAEINQKLKHGWNPIIEENAENAFKTIAQGIQHYRSHFMPDRPDSIRTYNSLLNIFSEWCRTHHKISTPCSIFSRDDASQFLIDSSLKKNLKPRTYNNYLVVMRTVFNRLIEHQYCIKNPFADMKKKRATEKNRAAIPDVIIDRIRVDIEKNYPAFMIVMKLIYYCGIRPNEICNLRISNLRLASNIIFLHGHQTKNKKEESVTVPDHLAIDILDHCKTAVADEYVFAKETHLMPGKNKLCPRSLSKLWDKMRRRLELPQEYKLYSLKDTGATMFAGIISPLELKNQMRHGDLRMTEIYIRRAAPVANEKIKKMEQTL